MTTEEKKEIKVVEKVKELDMTSDKHLPIEVEKEKKELLLLAELEKIKEALLSGKCPAKIMEMEEKISWKDTIFKEEFKSNDELFKHLTKTTDFEISKSIITSGVSAMIGQNNAEKYNIVLQTLADSEPKDATEAKLCLQAHVLYTQGMTYLSRAEQNNSITQSEFCLKNATKLLRLHNETIEAFSKYRRGGTQNVVVQHVQVNDGGKAIVGNMIAGGGVK